MSAVPDSAQVPNVSSFRHAMNMEEGMQLKTDVFPQVYKRRREINRRKGSGRTTKTRSFVLECRNQNAVPRKSILKTVNQRRSDGEERSVRFAAIDENSEPFMAQSRRNKIDHRPGSGRNTSSRFFKFEKPLKYHPLHQLDTNVIDEVPNISDNEIGDFDDFILQHGDGDGFDAPEAFEEGDLHERNGQDGQGIFFKKVTKPRGPPNQRLRALMAARQSLMDQGLGQGDGGVRRSKRTRVRPLEYWRNEKVVYGRQYRSLPTIADVEFKSPDPEWPKPKTKNRQKKSAEGEERIA